MTECLKYPTYSRFILESYFIIEGDPLSLINFIIYFLTVVHKKMIGYAAEYVIIKPLSHS
jgi:hypothetical protein